MTAVCQGGASRPRAGLVGNAFNTASGIASFLSQILPAPVAIGIAAVAALETFDIAQYCALDPPADPILNAQDIIDFMNPAALETYLPAVTKIRVWWRHIYWWQVCECSDVATPPPPAPSNPGNQSPNAGLPSGGRVSCYESKAGYTATGATAGNTTLDLTPIWMPPTSDTIPVTVQFPIAAVSGRAFRIPQNVNDINWITQNQGAPSPAPTNAFDAAVEFFNATGGSLGGRQFLTSQAVQIGPLSGASALPNGTAYIAILAENTHDLSVSGKVMSWSVDFHFGCPGDGIASPCCPPDPSLDFKLNQLLQLVLNLSSSSAPAIPTGWHDGVRHSGLEKAGSFLTAPAAIGVRFEVTTIPPGFQVSPGDPNFYWDLGFITPFALGSPMRGWRLLYNPHSFHFPDFTDQIGYTLAAGVRADAVELLPTTS